MIKSEPVMPDTESESSQILSKLADISHGFENTIADLNTKLISISEPDKPNESSKDMQVVKSRPPLFLELHELANMLSKQLSALREVSNRVNL